jgi:AbrB family looped-hinge helix DNA binding protein
MSTAQVTTRGRITIPAKVRADMKAKPGDQIEFVEVGFNQFQMVVKRSPKRMTNAQSDAVIATQKV